MNETHLYRHYSEDGKLLYVGISSDALIRLRQHFSRSAWAEEIVAVRIQRFSTREEAIEAEKVAARKENPKWNKALVFAERRYKKYQDRTRRDDKAESIKIIDTVTPYLKRLLRNKNKSQFARSVKTSPQILCDILAGRRPYSQRLLKRLGFRLVVRYERIGS